MGDLSRFSKYCQYTAPQEAAALPALLVDDTITLILPISGFTCFPSNTFLK